MKESLQKQARDAARFAYAPVSGFRVGAALTGPGGTFTGCNVENVSLGLSICAERVALFNAISKGERDFTELAVAAAGGEDAPPCGACRQVLAQFAPGIRITFTQNGELLTRTIEELLPEAFGIQDGASA